MLAVGWVAWASAMLIEDLGAVDSLKRSWQLTSARKWQVLGVGIGLFVLAIIISSIVNGIAGGLGQNSLEPPNFNTTVLTIIGTIAPSATPAISGENPTPRCLGGARGCLAGQRRGEASSTPSRPPP